jgi:hypothetical protein
MNRRELPFVYENGLKALPTQTTVASWGAGPGIGGMINYLLVVHGEQSVTMHRPMPTGGVHHADSRILGAYDKGPGKGAVIYTETTLTLETGRSWRRWWARRSRGATAASAGPRRGAPSRTRRRSARRT